MDRIDASTEFIRASTIARRLDLKTDSATRQVRRGMYGPPRMMHGEWAVRVVDYESWLQNVARPTPGHVNSLRVLRRGRHTLAA